MNFRSGAVISVIGLALLVWSDPAQSQAWLDPRCKELPLGKSLSAGPSGVDAIGPVVELRDGRLLTVEGGATRNSNDDGNTWSKPKNIYDGPGPGIPGRGLLLKTRDGVLVLVYMDGSTAKWGWNSSQKVADVDVRLDVWSIRSLDDGETWSDRQMIAQGYCGDLINMIQTSSGQIVVPVMCMIDRKRHATFTCVSADEGKTWRKGNIVDVGGNGDHDGSIEATVAELTDGRVLMLLRTSLDHFWEAYSDDSGRYWREAKPSLIDASSSPGHLIRLASGRLALVWNRLYPTTNDSWYSQERRSNWPPDWKKKYPDGPDRFPRTPPHGDRSETAASWHHDELSLAFSDDDAKTWSEPIVIASKSPYHELSYPFIFERRPGQLWIIVRDGNRLSFSLNESDFVQK